MQTHKQEVDLICYICNKKTITLSFDYIDKLFSEIPGYIPVLKYSKHAKCSERDSSLPILDPSHPYYIIWRKQ